MPMLILWMLQWIELRGANWAGALVTAVGASATAAMAITIRALAGENLARRALPFLILTPTAICLATSMDALFLGVAAWSTARITQAATTSHRTSPRPPRGTIPLLSSRAVDWGDKRFHRLWITFSCPHIAQSVTALLIQALVRSPW
jgi:hypothetical protein